MSAMSERRKAAQEHLAQIQSKLEPTPVPDGYERADKWDPAVPLVCVVCGASVTDGAAELHLSWHSDTR